MVHSAWSALAHLCDCSAARGLSFLALVAIVSDLHGQPPPASDKGIVLKIAPEQSVEDKAILNEIKEAYKAPLEVHEDVLKELRKSYEQPSPDRETKIVKELRRLYRLTDAQEEAILREVRATVRERSDEQEVRFFRAVQKLDRLPEGAVPATVQQELARKLFKKLDVDGDGSLSTQEMPEPLRGQLKRWDANRDGAIDFDEYWAYYQGRLGSLSDQVAAGEIDLQLKRGGPTPKPPTSAEEEQRPQVFRAGKWPKELPEWFIKLDTDGDGQVGLYEWIAAGRALDEFTKMDRNDDKFITIAEALFYFAKQANTRPEGPANPPKTQPMNSIKP